MEQADFKRMLDKRYGITAPVSGGNYQEFFMTYYHFVQGNMGQSGLNRFIRYNFNLMTLELIQQLDDIYENFAADAIILYILECVNDFEKDIGLEMLKKFMIRYSNSYEHTKSLVRTIHTLHEQEYDEDEIIDIVTIVVPHMNKQAVYEHIVQRNYTFVIDLLRSINKNRLL